MIKQENKWNFIEIYTGKKAKHAVALYLIYLIIYNIARVKQKKGEKIMNELKILLDSTCNMTPELLEEFDVGYVPMSVSIDDKQYPATLDWNAMTPHDFYDIMRSGKRPYTQAIPEATYTEYFTALAKENKDILYIGCSSALSGSVKIGAKIAKEVMKEYPSVKIIVIDALNSGMGQGMMGIRASEMRKEGKTIDEIAAVIQREKLKYNQWAYTGSLKYLKNAGRVKASAAFFGDIIGIKPIIISDVEGNNYAYKKVRGKKAALQELADSIIANAIDPENNYLSIDNADCEADAQELLKLLEGKIHFKRVFIVPLGPILGASCGPDTLIAYHYGKEVTIKGE